jgi:hypothetical protein
MNWKTNGKALMELLGAAVMAGVVTYQEVVAGGVTMSEWIMVVIALAGVANVWAAANLTNFDKAKTLVSVLFVVLNLLVGFLTDSRLSGDEIMLLVIQGLSTLGVAGAPAIKHLTTGQATIAR